MTEVTFDLMSLDVTQINALIDGADAPKKGYITPVVQEFVNSNAIQCDMSAKVRWPKKDDGTEKTVKEQVTALEQNIKNHKTKVLEGKAEAWPNLIAAAVTPNGSDTQVALLVNKDLLDVELAKIAADKDKAAGK